MVSFNITYYNEPKWLLWWYDRMVELDKQGCDFYLNVCDDGSQTYPATKFFKKYPPLPQMRLFRVTEDIGFNSHGARNLLMKTTLTDWNVMSDIDRRYPLDHMVEMTDCDLILKEGNYYSFREITKASPDGFSVNEYIVHKNDFWKTGGYDEEFVNIHFGDRYFLDCLRQVAHRQKKQEWGVKYARGARDVTWLDIPKTIYPDDKTLIHPIGRWGNEEFRFGLKEMVQKRNRTHEGRMSKQVINFPWEQVF